MGRLGALLFALLASAPVVAAPVPKPQSVVVLGRARTDAPAPISAEGRRLLARADAAITAASAAYEVAMTAHMAALDADPEATPPEPQLDYGEARRLLHEALDRLGPRDAGRDVALYLAGWVAAEELRDADAVARFGELATRYPLSRYAAEAAYRLGDLHFDRGDLEAARRAYERVVIGGRGPFYALGLYKLAWTAYRQDRLDDAWRRFDALVVDADRSPEDDRARSLRPEALAYLALLLVEPTGEDGRPPPWSRITARLDGSWLHHAEVAERAAEVARTSGEKALARRLGALAAELKGPVKATPPPR